VGVNVGTGRHGVIKRVAPGSAARRTLPFGNLKVGFRRQSNATPAPAMKTACPVTAAKEMGQVMSAEEACCHRTLT
jgi:hypothetical protein